MNATEQPLPLGLPGVTTSRLRCPFPARKSPTKGMCRWKAGWVGSKGDMVVNRAHPPGMDDVFPLPKREQALKIRENIRWDLSVDNCCHRCQFPPCVVHAISTVCDTRYTPTTTFVT